METKNVIITFLAILLFYAIFTQKTVEVVSEVVIERVDTIYSVEDVHHYDTIVITKEVIEYVDITNNKIVHKLPQSKSSFSERMDAIGGFSGKQKSFQ